jgi:4-hydroxy-tetrahydrodipicolinate reductase
MSISHRWIDERRCLLLFGYGGKMGTDVRHLLPFGPFEEAVAPSSLNGNDEAQCVACIDFSTPILCPNVVETCRRLRLPLISGTTGFSDEQWLQLKSLATLVPVVHANNFATGAKIFLELMPLLARSLPLFDVAIVEHHNRRKDPELSGTARDAKTLLEQNDATIVATHSIRAGGVISEHSVIFVNEDEKIVVSHGVTRRRAFAVGALRVAQALVEREVAPGLYEAKDFL